MRWEQERRPFAFVFVRSEQLLFSEKLSQTVEVMIQTIEIFYSFQCPYSYLAIDRLSELETKFDIRSLWQPFSAKAAGQNYQSFPSSPERLSYIREDVSRLAQARGVPLVFPADWPERGAAAP